VVKFANLIKLPTITFQLKTEINKKESYIMGHSQGGAIAYLLTAHLLSLQKENKIPSEIVFKTYCSAAPKPGNLHFAYALTSGGTRTIKISIDTSDFEGY
jgi:predicted esterase